MGWTKEQEKVIGERNKDILVSAAAGSGKTAVLVERIIGKVLSKDNPVDIDRILVLTFTKDAAREMRDRVRRAIDEAAAKNPGDKRIERQRTLVHYAHIATIDSFCNYVVKNNFQDIDVDPDFRVMDEAEDAISKNEAMDRVLEENYRENDPAFLSLLKAYGTKGSDSEVRDLIYDFYNKKESFAWPDKWLSEIEDIYKAESLSDMLEQDWIKAYEKYLRENLLDYVERINSVADHFAETKGCMEFASFIRSDADSLNDALSKNDSREFFSAIKNISFATLSKKDADNDTKEDFKSHYRPAWTDPLKKLAKSFPDSLDFAVDEMKALKPYVDELVKLTRQFDSAFKEIKDDANALDFSDVEHAALRILVDEKSGQPTDAAEELQEFFDEVMVDEYQDSNEVQEVLLKAVSGDSRGHHNYFCVGDVKQSIYRFRQADPEIFMKKFKDFKDENDEHVRIDLDKNFRSRRQVLDITNDTFYGIMAEDMGGVDYTEDVSLKCGADFYLDEDNHIYDPEIYYADPSEEDLDVTGCRSVTEYEFKLIAARIKRLIDDKFPVQDKKKNAKGEDEYFLRPIKYSDIAILSRSKSDESGDMTLLLDTLRSFGVEAVFSDRKGYFTELEVETVLSFLEILNNPNKDIELASVLTSKIGGLSNDDLMEIRAYSGAGRFYASCRNYIVAPETGNPELLAKLKMFFSLYDELRNNHTDMTLPQIINAIFERTGFLYYVSSLPAGETRKGNLLKLLEVAEQMESTSTHDLYSFIDYIRKRKEFKQEISMAALKGEEDNVVRIMTIHKSKGLEFPVVFLIRAGKQFNDMDKRDKAAFSSKYGMSLKLTLGDKYRVSYPTFYLKTLRLLNTVEDRGEEQRILYVAMTRAKEKLIITGALKKGSKDETALDRYEYASAFPTMLSEKMSAKCYFDWILPAILDIRDQNGSRKYEIVRGSLSHAVTEEARLELKEAEKKAALTTLMRSAERDGLTKIKEQTDFEYVYGPEHKYKSKYSVSEVKHMEIDLHQALKADAGEEIYATEDRLFLQRSDETDESLPKKYGYEKTDQSTDSEDNFLDKKSLCKTSDKENLGTLRGTAMHRAMEGLSFTKEYTKDSLIAELDQMTERHFLSKEERGLLSIDKILKFLESDICKEMAEAESDKRLLREQNFVYSEKLSKIFSGLVDDSQSLDAEALIQGTIDALVVGSDEVVIIDYKTDRVVSADELKDRYTRQLQLYGEAARRAMGKNKMRLYLYSFSLGQTVEVEPISE